MDVMGSIFLPSSLFHTFEVLLLNSFSCNCTIFTYFFIFDGFCLGYKQWQKCIILNT